MQRIYKLPPFKLVLLFWTITVLLWGIAWRSGFERDFHGWFEIFYNLPFWDCINRKGSSITSLYQVTQLQLWGWSWLFGTHVLFWSLLQLTLYAGAATTVVVFCRNLYTDFGWKNAAATAFWGGILFLTAPAYAEIVLWKAAYHYPVAVLLCFGCWSFVRRALLTGKKAPLVYGVLLYALATFTLELFWAILPLSVLLFLYYRRQAGISVTKQVLWGALVPMGLLFASHFWLYHLVFGNYIPHTEGPLRVALQTPLHSLSRTLQYDFHLLLQGRYWPSSLRDSMYEICSGPVAGGFVAIAGAGGGLFLTLKSIRNPKWAPVLWLFAGGVLGLLFVLPLPVVTWGLYYNDRYNYFTGLFQWQLVVIGIFQLHFRVRNFLLAFSTICFALLSFYMAGQCRQAAIVFWRTLQSFPVRASKSPLLLLNVPHNLKGIVIFQEGPAAQEFNSHLRIYTGDSVYAPVQSIAGYGIDAIEEGVRVQVKSRRELEVNIAASGTWFWNGSLGASSHETPLYKMELGEWAHRYNLKLKDTTTRVFYFNNLTWKEVDFSIQNREQE